MANRKVYKYIEAVLLEHGVLRREEIWKAVFERFNYAEGDIGRRCREMSNVICTRLKTCGIEQNGRIVTPYVYYLGNEKSK